MTAAAKILDAALARAGRAGWGNVKLRDVAADLKIPMAAVRVHFGERNDLADAWLARADAAMLKPYPKNFAKAPPPERVHLVMMRWLDALAPHHQVTADMLAEKLWLFHPHHYVPMIPWVSRTVQWMREAAQLDGPGRRKQIEEIGMTLLFVATLRVWCRDTSEGQAHTRAWLARRLERSDRVMARLKPLLPAG